MKTHTMIYGYDFSTEIIEINYSGRVGYIVLHCCKSSLNDECVVHNDIFPCKLNYDLFKEIHNKIIYRKIGK